MGSSQIPFRLTPPRVKVNRVSHIVKAGKAKEPRLPCGGGDEIEGCCLVSPDAARVMVVVDPGLDAEAALEWALSHAVDNSHRDCIVLLQVLAFGQSSIISSKASVLYRAGTLRGHEVLQSMKATCESRKPSLKVEVVAVKGEKNMGPLIVEEAKKHRVSLLVMGRRRQPVMWQMARRFWWERKGRPCLGMVDYCIQNASCMAIAVRRKSGNLGGYSITTKRHKNFWHLA
ncbi:hypothetical protein SAY87_004252 [Trapa incisa]|uniref:UspA domain-containing protein n=1 Tax=Trapa incisa TaxID=236973 RepID=A0AAN7PS78_9MYRT|nr:hypothetical protein SAY87_004252 [Trapa incisa]